ncbi:hypothetical protein [Methanoregula formicica]|nr:hypothetical protein [Methanoregula formicica]
MPRDDLTMPDTTTPDKTPGTDPATGIPLFRSRKLSPYTMKRISKGTDIYLKVDEHKETSFYILHWTEEEKGCTKGSEDCRKIPYSYSTVTINEECAIRLLRGLVIMPDTRSGVEFGNILKYVPGYFRSVKRSLDVVYVVQDDSCEKYFEYFRQGPEISQ